MIDTWMGARDEITTQWTEELRVLASAITGDVQTSNVLAVRVRGIDPNRLLNWLAPVAKIFFHPIGVAAGWTPLSFKLYYLFGAILNVPWLALGTVELLRQPVAEPLTRRRQVGGTAGELHLWGRIRR